MIFLLPSLPKHSNINNCSSKLLKRNKGADYSAPLLLLMNLGS